MSTTPIQVNAGAGFGSIPGPWKGVETEAVLKQKAQWRKEGQDGKHHKRCLYSFVLPIQRQINGIALGGDITGIRYSG